MKSFRFTHRLRVRWAEVDMQKIVFNPHYLMYLDCAIIDYWRALALPYEQACRELGGELYLRQSSLEFHASAHCDDDLAIGLRCTRVGVSSIGFEAAIFRAETRLTSATLVYVFADPATQTARPVPPALRATLLGFEAGEAMLELRCGDWATLGVAASAVRSHVFVQEQGVPQEQEWDAADATALHAVAFNRLGQALATGRLLRDGSGVARIGRMAVERALRGQQIGSRILETLTDAARALGERELLLHAQCSAQSFYERQGFRPQGLPFDEVGIAHIEMRRSL